MGSTVGWFDLGWLGHTICSYCEEMIGGQDKCIRVQMTKDIINLHNGNCWNQFVAAIAAFNDTLWEEEKVKVN